MGLFHMQGSPGDAAVKWAKCSGAWRTQENAETGRPCPTMAHAGQCMQHTASGKHGSEPCLWQR